MFGYIAANQQAFSKEEKDRYRKYYCGLCHQLDMQYGSIGRASLTYDMTFLSMLLSSLYDLEETRSSRHCIHHPVKGCPYVVTSAAAYAADMNLILTYYQCLDDWRDDCNLISKKKSRRLEKYLPRVKEANPCQSMAIADSLQCLEEMEKANELNPDLPCQLLRTIDGGVIYLAPG